MKLTKFEKMTKGKFEDMLFDLNGSKTLDYSTHHEQTDKEGA